MPAPMASVQTRVVVGDRPFDGQMTLCVEGPCAIEGPFAIEGPLAIEGKDTAMKPTRVGRNYGGDAMGWTVRDTALGPVLIAATAKGICRLAFGEGQEDIARYFPDARLEEGGALITALADRVVAVIEQPGAANVADIPLDLRGTAFQEAVWQALCAIPAGETRSYTDLALAVGRPKATRAAGSANGANPVAVLVPCHRVIRADGGLGGYAYGTAIKQELLRREAC